MRQYFSLYRERERERREKNRERGNYRREKNCQTTPTRTYFKTVIHLAGRPGTENYPEQSPDPNSPVQGPKTRVESEKKERGKIILNNRQA